MSRGLVGCTSLVCDRTIKTRTQHYRRKRNVQSKIVSKVGFVSDASITPYSYTAHTQGVTTTSHAFVVFATLIHLLPDCTFVPRYNTMYYTRVYSGEVPRLLPAEIKDSGDIRQLLLGIQVQLSTTSCYTNTSFDTFRFKKHLCW